MVGIDVCLVHQLHRTVLVETTRVENHLLNVACHAGDMECLLALLLGVMACVSIDIVLATPCCMEDGVMTVVHGVLSSTHTVRHVVSITKTC